MKARLRRALLLAIGLLYVVSVPWYRSAEQPPGTLLGLPDWVTVALCCYVLVAFCNAAAWLLADVRDAPPADREEP